MLPLLFSAVVFSATPTPPYTWHGDRWIIGDLYVDQIFGNVSGATITDVSDQIPQDDLEYILSELWARPIGGGIEHVLTDPQPFDFMVYSASTIINKSTAALGLGNAIYRDATDEVFYNLDLVSGKAVMDYMNLIENEIGPFREVYYVEGESPYSYKDHVAGVAHNGAGLVLLAGENGHIYRSPNYGLNWEDLGYLTVNVIRFVVYLGGQTWAFGDGSKIYRTVDDGETWDAGTTTAVSQLYSMTPMLSGGAITAYQNTVYRTLDAGTTWETLPVGMIGSVTPSFGLFPELLFIDTEGLGYDQVLAFGTVTGGTNVVLRSNDYGSTWTYDEVNVPAAMGEIARDAVTGNLYTSQANNVVSGLDVWESTDDGLTWTPLGLDSGEYYIYKIVPLRDGRILICTYPTGYIYQYRDGIWTRIWSPTYNLDKEHYPEWTDYLTDLGHGVVIGVFNEHWSTGEPDWWEIEAIHVLRSDKFETLELGTAAYRNAVDTFAADETLPSGTAVWKYLQTLPSCGEHDHGTGTTGNLVKFATGETGEITDSVLQEIDGKISAPGEIQAATIAVLNGSGALTLGVEGSLNVIDSNQSLILRTGNGNGSIVPQGIIEFDDVVQDKIRFYSHSYAIGLEPFTLTFRSDRDFRWDSDTLSNRMFLDESGNLTLAGKLISATSELDRVQFTSLLGDKINLYMDLYTIGIDPDTLYFNTDDHFEWRVDNTPVMVVDSLGNLTLDGMLTSANSELWDKALQWDGGAAGLDAATGRNSLGLGSAALSLATDFAGAGHNHGTGTTAYVPKFATGATGEITDSVLAEVDGRIVAPGEIQAATLRVTDGMSSFTIGKEGDLNVLRGNQDIVIDPTNNGSAAGVIVPATMMKFPDFLGDKIRFFSHSYALSLDPFTLVYRSDRNHRWDSDTVPNLMFLDESGNLTVAGTINGHYDLVRFTPLLGDKIQLYEDLYAIGIDDYRMFFRSDADYEWRNWASDTVMYLDEWGNLTIPGNFSSANSAVWDKAMQWDGGSTNLNPATGRTSLQLDSYYSPISHNHGTGTAYTIPRWSDTSGNLANSTLLTDSSGRFALGGSIYSTAQLHIDQSPSYSMGMLIQRTNTSDTTLNSLNAIHTVMSPTYASTGSKYLQNIRSYNTPIVQSGYTNSAYATSFEGVMLRNYQGASSDDNGSLSGLYGMLVSYGHGVTNPSASPQTTNVMGIGFIPQRSSGTITNMYDIYISSDQTGGTVTNRYGIYQVPSSATNILASPLSVGTTSTYPGYKLAVGGSVRVNTNVYAVGKIGIGVEPSSNILQVVQSSATDPIADEWTTYSTLDSKTDVKPVDESKQATVVDQLKQVNLIEYKRPILQKEPVLSDYTDMPIYEEVDGEQKIVEIVSAEEQYQKDLAEYQAALENPKFTTPRLGVDANDPSVPEHWRAYNQEGQVVGVNLGAQVGDLLATVKAQQQAIEALQSEVAALKVRVSKLEGGRGQ